MTLKCDPVWAVELREIHATVRPGVSHEQAPLETVDMNGTVDNRELQAMIDHPYKVVVGRLPRRKRDHLSRTVTITFDRLDAHGAC